MPGNALTFVQTQHKHPAPAIDPSAVRLPPNFTVCVLGASRGIGASIAHAYAQAGASTLILAARSTSALSDVAAQCTNLRPSLHVHCEPCDIASNSSVESLAACIKELCGRLDVVVVSSGFKGQGVSGVTDTDPEEWKRCFDVNTVGTYNAAYHLVPLLLQTPGGARAFVAISTFGLWWTTGPPVRTSGYLISKLAQLRLVEMMAQQYQEEGLLSVGVHPGTVATEMTKGLPAEFLRRELFPAKSLSSLLRADEMC